MKKILRIPYDRVLLCLAPIEQLPRVLAPGTIPPGSSILAVHENHACRSFDFVLQHDSFPPTEPGVMLPVIENVTWNVLVYCPPAQGKTESIGCMADVFGSIETSAS